jgi:hypothetical protein
MDNWHFYITSLLLLGLAAVAIVWMGSQGAKELDSSLPYVAIGIVALAIVGLIITRILTREKKDGHLRRRTFLSHNINPLWTVMISIIGLIYAFYLAPYILSVSMHLFLVPLMVSSFGVIFAYSAVEIVAKIFHDKQ